MISIITLERIKIYLLLSQYNSRMCDSNTRNKGQFPNLKNISLHPEDKYRKIITLDNKLTVFISDKKHWLEMNSYHIIDGTCVSLQDLPLQSTTDCAAYTTEIYCLGALEAGCLKSTCQHHRLLQSLDRKWRLCSRLFLACEWLSSPYFFSHCLPFCVSVSVSKFTIFIRMPIVLD